jgi:hypothetical protein
MHFGVHSGFLSVLNMYFSNLEISPQMKVSHLLCLSLIMFSFGLFAQLPYAEHISEPIVLSKDQKGFVNEIIGEDDKNIFLLIQEKEDGTGQTLIKAINKESLKEEGTAFVFENSNEASDYTYRNSFQTKNGFICFFETQKKGLVNIYATTVGSNFEVTEKLSMIFEYDEKLLEVRFLQDKKRSDFVLISQRYVEEGEEVEIEYFLYDERFKLLNEGKIKTGIFSDISLKKAVRKSTDQLDNYRLSPKGDLIGLTYTLEKKEEWTSGYFQIGFTNTQNGNTENFPIKLENAVFDDYSVIIENNAVTITGFYQDRVEKDRLYGDNKITTSSGRINGTFFRRYDLENYKLFQSSQLEIDEELAKKVDKGNPATQGNFLRNKESEEAGGNDLSASYSITDVIFNEEKEIATFYCEYKYQYTETDRYRYGRTTYNQKTYYSVRGNIFIFQISLIDGTIKWTSNLRKFYRLHSGNSKVKNEVTTKVIPGKERDYIFYKTTRFYDESDFSDLDGEEIEVKYLENAFLTTLLNRDNGEINSYKPELMQSKNYSKDYEKTDFKSLYQSSDKQVLFSINSPEKVNIVEDILGFCPDFLLPILGITNASTTFSISKITLDK